MSDAPSWGSAFPGGALRVLSSVRMDFNAAFQSQFIPLSALLHFFVTR
jgi:hypothetical protein